MQRQQIRDKKSKKTVILQDKKVVVSPLGEKEINLQAAEPEQSQPAMPELQFPPMQQ